MKMFEGGYDNIKVTTPEDLVDWTCKEVFHKLKCYMIS